MNALHRRRFLRAVMGTGGLLGAASAAFHWWPARAGSPPAVPAGSDVWTSVSHALGTQVKITVAHPNQTQAERAVRSAFERLRLVERLMSIYSEDSQVSQLNRDKRLGSPHRLLVGVLKTAADMSRRTQGAFDVTVQPLWDLYYRRQQDQKLPTRDEIAAARRDCDWHRVLVNADEVRLIGSRTRITLNGIAQGLAADQAVEALRAGGIEHALIDSGEIAPLGDKQNGKPWAVGIQHPRNADQFLAIAQLDGRCLATSGDYATVFSKDFHAHHLFDPRTGRSPDQCASATVAAPTGMLADALSTAVFVLGPQAGLRLVRGIEQCDALIVDKQGRRYQTTGFPG